VSGSKVTSIRSVKTGRDCSPPPTEHHYTTDDLAKFWGLSRTALCRLVSTQPGVIRIDRTGRRLRPGYLVPLSVALAIYPQQQLRSDQATRPSSVVSIRR
jgi:hypothetical protein